MPPVIAAVAAVGSAIGAVASTVGVVAFAGASAVGFSAAAAVAIGGAITSLAATGIVAGLLAGASKLAQVAGLIGGGPRITLPDLDRLNLTQVANAPRKIIFGTTAMAADLRYTEPSGEGQRFVDAVIHLGSSKCTALDSIYINDELAWTFTGGVQGIYAGYMSVWPIMEGGPSSYYVINGGAKWGSAQRMTGCCLVRIRIDRRGATDSETSPFVNGLPTNIRFIGRGIPLYDPRRDSTMGGSGPHRWYDQSTWQFTDGATDLGNNIALQALTYLLGWRVMGKVSVGVGLPIDRLDVAAFAASANACDEAIALAAGGTQRRYEGGGLFNDNDQPGSVMAAFAAACNGWWSDSSGKLGLHVAVNDLAGATVSITSDDILGPIGWEPFPPIDEQYNVVRGQNPDPQPTALYQPTDIPEVRIASPDGIDHVLPNSLALVQEKRRAQRINKQVLQRQQYRGKLTITVGVRGWLLSFGDPCRVSIHILGWSNKLFRVETWTVNMDATVNLVLREENAAIYAWDREEAPAVVPATPVFYDPRNAPGAQGGEDGLNNATVTLFKRGATAPAGPSGTFTYTFATSVLSGGTLNGWSQAFPADDGNPAWRIDAPASAATATVAVPAASFTAPVNAVQSGTAGAPGLNGATAMLWKRGATAPALPSTTSTWTFATGVLTGHNNGWSQSPPSADGNPLWLTTATASGTGATDAIPASEWSAAAQIAENGSNGAPGVSTAMVALFKRGATAPADPTGTFTYTFATGVLSGGTLNGWSQTQPASDGNPLWAKQASAVGTGATVSIAAASFSGASKILQDGADGAPGLSIAASRPVMNVGLFPNGSPKPGQLPQTTQMIVYAGDTNVTGGATYSVTAMANCTASHSGGGLFTLTAVSGLPASFTVQATYGGKSIAMAISVAAPKDGPAASNNSAALGAPTSGGSYGAALAYVDLVVADGATVQANAGLEYRAVDNGVGSRTITLRGVVSIENLTDAGAPSYGASVVGSQAVYIHGDGDSDLGYVSAEYAVTNGTGQPKTFRAKFYTLKEAGNSTARTSAGDWGGTIFISAA